MSHGTTAHVASFALRLPQNKNINGSWQVKFFYYFSPLAGKLAKHVTTTNVVEQQPMQQDATPHATSELYQSGTFGPRLLLLNQ